MTMFSKAKSVAKQRLRINRQLMKSGVNIIDPYNTYIDPDVIIGKGTTVYPNCHIKGSSHIGENCSIGPNTTVENCTIGEYTTVSHSVICDSSIGNKTNVGPFAYIRPNCVVGDNIKVGDFVELKNSIIADGTKI